MATTPEREHEVQSQPKVPEGVQERPEQMIVPERIQDLAKPTQTQVTAQVTDDQGQQLIQTSQTTLPVITIASDVTDDQLEELSKGSSLDSITWLATFWIRAIKKAMHFGRKIVRGSNK